MQKKISAQLAPVEAATIFGPHNGGEWQHPSTVCSISRASQVQALNDAGEFVHRARASNCGLRVRSRCPHPDELDVSILPKVKHTSSAVARSSSKSEAHSSHSRVVDNGTGTSAGSLLAASSDSSCAFCVSVRIW